MGFVKKNKRNNLFTCFDKEKELGVYFGDVLNLLGGARENQNLN